MRLKDTGCFATAIRKASRRLTHFYDEALAPSGLRATQFSILGELAIRPDATPALSDLAEMLVMDRSALGHTLRPLIRDGYLALRQSEADRRVQQVLLTAKGQAKFLESEACWRKAQQAFAALHGQDWAETARDMVLTIAHDDRLGTMKGESA